APRRRADSQWARERNEPGLQKPLATDYTDFHRCCSRFAVRSVFLEFGSASFASHRDAATVTQKKIFRHGAAPVDLAKDSPSRCEHRDRQANARARPRQNLFQRCFPHAAISKSRGAEGRLATCEA